MSGDDHAVPVLLQLAPGDNVLIAARRIEPGPRLASSGELIAVTELVELGHKVAARPIAAGERVLRYGMPIGSAVTAISAGAWVHTHNLASDYIVTFAHRGGER